ALSRLFVLVEYFFIGYQLKERLCVFFQKGTSKNRFEKGKWVEGTECEESLLARLYALLGGATRCCEAKALSDGTDAVVAKLSLFDRSRRCALHIFTQTRFLEVTKRKGSDSNEARPANGGAEFRRAYRQR
ncbi:MAG: hypothetical protein ACI4RK_00870, partial [Oscillospiraceae bacterium]